MRSVLGVLLLATLAAAAEYCWETVEEDVEVNCHDCDCATCYSCGCHVSLGSCDHDSCSSHYCWTSIAHCCRDSDCGYSCNCDTCCDTETVEVCANSTSYAVASADPAVVPAAGGATVRLVGEGFLNTGAITCAFGDEQVAGLFMSATEVDCTAPEGDRGTVDLSLSLDGDDWTDPVDFTYYECTDDCNGGACQEDETCECPDGAVGAACEFACPTGGDAGAVCSGFGVCSAGADAAECACDDSHWGANCSLPCPADDAGAVCSGQGFCVQASGECSCFEGFTGALCAHNYTCSGDDDSQASCSCEPGYFGEDCADVCPGTDESTCEPGVGCEVTCSAHGQCTSSGACWCDAGWFGDDCAGECPGGSASPCSDHGSCAMATGECTCDAGWFGDDCSSECPGGADSPCSDHGSCSTSGLCTCDAGYGTADCSAACGVDFGQICSGNGTCDAADGVCDCDNDFWGDACELLCAEGDNGDVCSGYGHCTSTGTCACVSGWWGDVCDQECPGGHDQPCSGNGVCSPTSGACICLTGFYGDACDESCPGTSTADGTTCSGHGTCLSADGTCSCASTYTGDDCSERECVEDCHGNGNCTAAAECECFAGWTGDYCSVEDLPDADLSTLSFNPTRYLVVEGAGSMFLNVTRLGNLDHEASCAYESLDVSAHAGLDYVSGAGQLEWAAGDGSPRLVEFTILEDSTLEGVELFEVRLSGASEYAVIDADTAYVQIEANVEDGTSTFAVEHFLVLRPYADIVEGTEAGEEFKDHLVGGVAAALGIGSEQVSVSQMVATSSGNETLVGVDLVPASGESASDLAEQLYALIRDQDPALTTDDMNTYVQIDFTVQPWWTLSVDTASAADDDDVAISPTLLAALAAGGAFVVILGGVAYWQRKAVVEHLLWRLAAWRFSHLREERYAEAAEMTRLEDPSGVGGMSSGAKVHEVVMPSLSTDME